ncbi:hypothetical protein [Thermovibrio ammonificans]|jgi:hypothetical protein|uniref:Lipoprotein n=1 Tax=Thermovibrio ammonificans (strain DSM 15698 / JCM 12110 / HB-1) TaxID=648996 RepID=E8T5R4_THEA1|nr:hypothetical protein [Thermovibrio ammonificans]ADU96539.1 hypothetical protein Theam_0567 [Thermovibrio ammonificans HB-1]
MLKLAALALCGTLLTGCVPLLVAAGAGAAGGYYVGKHYDIKVKSPVEVKREK